jgi:hypothetical protein
MSRLLLAAALAAILLLVGAFVPVGGRTLVERWNAAPSAGRFAEKGWNEVVSTWDSLWGTKPASRPGSRPAPAKAPARTAKAPEKAAPAPVEHHTDADRTAVDRLVAEHARDGQAPPR